MLRVPIQNAKPGMVLALPVMNPQAAGRPLLLADYRMTSQTIHRLFELGVAEMWVRYPGLDAVDKYVDPQVLERRSRLASRLKRSLAPAQAGAAADLPYDDYLKSIGGLVEDLLKNPATVMFMEDLGDGSSDSLLTHCSANAFLALVLGLRLDWYLIRQRKRLSPRYAREVANLGLGAMLADIGLTRLDDDVRQRWLETGDTSDPAWRAHVRIGYEQMRGKVEPTPRFGGAGYRLLLFLLVSVILFSFLISNFGLENLKLNVDDINFLCGIIFKINEFLNFD